MDNEVVKFTCLRAQIPNYFTKIDRLTEVERAAKELKNAPVDESKNANSSSTDKQETSLLGKRTFNRHGLSSDIEAELGHKPSINSIKDKFGSHSSFPPLVGNESIIQHQGSHNVFSPQKL